MISLFDFIFSISFVHWLVALYFILFIFCQSQRFTTTCFEGLYMIVCIVCSHFRNHLTFFLNSLGEFDFPFLCSSFYSPVIPQSSDCSSSARLSSVLSLRSEFFAFYYQLLVSSFCLRKTCAVSGHFVNDFLSMVQKCPNVKMFILCSLIFGQNWHETCFWRIFSQPFDAEQWKW